MAITLIRKIDNDSGLEANMAFRTEHVHMEEPEGSGEMIEVVTVKAFVVDNNLKDTGRHGVTMYRVDDMTEEQFHTALRVQAAKKKHLVTSHSTNPEWNPEGYIRILEVSDKEKLAGDDQVV